MQRLAVVVLALAALACRDSRTGEHRKVIENAAEAQPAPQAGAPAQPGASSPDPNAPVLPTTPSVPLGDAGVVRSVSPSAPTVADAGVSDARRLSPLAAGAGAGSETLPDPGR